MEIVVDANIFIAALVKDSYTRKFLILSSHKFYTCEYVFEEINNHIKELEEKTGVEKEILIEILRDIIHFGNINVIPQAEFQNKLTEAKKITPDKDDAPYFALALKKNCPIWSNDKRLKSQNKITIYNTKEFTEKQI